VLTVFGKKVKDIKAPDRLAVGTMVDAKLFGVVKGPARLVVRCDIQDSTHFPDTKDSLEMNLFLDGSVLEAFVDQRSAFAARIYPTYGTARAFGSAAKGRVRR
jgi:hypothetical protein